MSTAASEETLPVLAAPPRRGGGASLFGFLLRGRDDWLESFGEDAFELPFLEQRLLWRRQLVVNDPAAIKRVLLDNADNYSKTAIARRLLEPGLGRGLITMEGEVWRRHRRMMAPSFDHHSLITYTPIITAVAERVHARWAALPAGSVIEMTQEMNRAALRIIARTMFSIDSAAIEATVADAVRSYQENLHPSILDLLGLPDWFPRWGRAAQGRRAGFGDMHGAMDRLIAERRRAPDRDGLDLLSRLLEAREETTGAPLTDAEIHAQALTILMAGHETVSIALAWTWYLLALHPHAEAKLHAELAAVLGGRRPEYDDLARLGYTRMVIEESMRLYPPAHTMSRLALGADELAGRRVAKGSVLLIVPWVLHRHRRLWQYPDRFEPERFAPERADERPRFAYIPFGAGPRICIGAAFAMTEAMLVLASLAQRYRARLVPGHPVEPNGLITLRARHGIKMTLERRD